jgi:hypothetical protein
MSVHLGFSDIKEMFGEILYCFNEKGMIGLMLLESGMLFNKALGRVENLEIKELQEFFVSKCRQALTLQSLR